MASTSDLDLTTEAQKKPEVLTGAEIRRRFIQFFERPERQSHQARKSASLVPSNPTVLLTPAGMLPFVPIFLGVEPPPTPPRSVSAQKCARVSGKASDLENVGRTPHHHTFFEMLGNFSFGDYFKEEAIAWAWEFITGDLSKGCLGLSKKHLWVTVLKTETLFDEESFKIWRDQVGIPEERILFCSEKDNFWGPPGPTGPCGPCSEIHYDRTPEKTSPKEDIDILEDVTRFTEIWNLVFMEQFQDAQGKRTLLEHKNIDTGMGLERITMVVQGKETNFDTDLFQPLIQDIAAQSGVPYGKSPETDTALRIVADHLRFAVFAIGDGIVPSNEGRGYILRMIIRRGVRYGRKVLGFDRPFFSALTASVVANYKEPYPVLAEKKAFIEQVIREEEARFLETLERGLKRLEEMLLDLKEGGQAEVLGEDAFKLYDTYGFPLELTQDIAQEQGLSVDKEGFNACMEKQRIMARGARKGGALVADQVYSKILSEGGATEFLGYDTLSCEATVKALILDGHSVKEVSGTNQAFEIVLDKTPFYAESGGQVGDRGTFSRDDGHHGLTVVVNDTIKVGELFVHQGLFDNGGVIRVGETLTAQVEPDYRQLAAIHHSATHLLNAALIRVLGENVSQAGSQVSPEGARFDFTLNRGMTRTEIQQVEYMMNQWVQENIPRDITIMTLEEAKASGAVAMFGEKYGETVRVISYGERSRELCGGTHVNALGEIGLVKITGESSIASGVRRVELVAGERAYKAFKLMEGELEKVAQMLKSPVRDVPKKLSKLLDDLKAQDKQLKQMDVQMAGQVADALLAEIDKTNPVLVRYLPGRSIDVLKAMAERLADQLDSYLLLLGSDAEGKAGFVCAVSDDFIEKGVKAGNIVKKAASLCGGGGGGKPNFAQAGGKDGTKVAEALEQMMKELNGS